MSPVGFESAISAGERSQTDTLYRAGNGTGVSVIAQYYGLQLKLCSMFRRLSVSVQHFISLLGQDEATVRVALDAACLSITLALC